MLSHVWLFGIPWTAARQASLSFTISPSLLKLMSIESVMPSYHLILCHPLFLLHSIFPSIRVFSNELALHIRWPKYWSFSFSMNASNDYSELISFRIDLFDLLAAQGTTPQFESIDSQMENYFIVTSSWDLNQRYSRKPDFFFSMNEYYIYNSNST